MNMVVATLKSNALVLCVFGLVIAGCVAPDGKTYYATPQEDYYGMYITGGLDSCVLIGLSQLEQSGVELDKDNTMFVAIQCENIVRALFRYRYQDIPEPLKHGLPSVQERKDKI